MLTRLFNQSLPSPTEEQLETMLTNRDIGLSSEIISVAYEPRFKLFALGSANGDFHIINDKNYWYSYTPTSPEPPILKIIPLTNSSTFLSLSSYSLYDGHCFNVPRENRPQQINDIFFKANSILSETKPDKSKSIITHWVVTYDGQILHRSISLKYDIIDFAASPLHPEFVLLLTKTGSLYGFSVEEMKFTDLYINDFEGKNVHSIICPFDMKFYICHDTIDKLDMTDKELSKGPQVNAAQVDIFNEKSNLIAAIDHPQKKSSLFKGNRPATSIEIPDGSFATCVSMISDKDWTSIVHSKESDSIYLGNQMKISLEGEMLVPSIVVEYQKPLTREGPQNVTFFTSSGRFINLNGNSMDHFMLNPIEPKYAYIDKNDNIYVFNVLKKCYIFEKNNYVGCFLFEWGKPLAILNSYALCLNEDNELFIADIKGSQQVKLESPLLPSSIVSTQFYENYIDFLCENDKIIRFDLNSKEIFEGEEVVDEQELAIYANYPKNDPEIKFWRPFNGTFASIKYVNGRYVLTVDNLTSNEVCEKNEKLIYFDVIDEGGKVTAKNATFILIVTTFYISIFAIDKKGLKRIRHVSISRDPIVEATVTAWGVLIVRTKKTVQLIVLPDVSYKPLARLTLNYDAPPPLNPITAPNDNDDDDDIETTGSNLDISTENASNEADIADEDEDHESSKKHKKKKDKSKDKNKEKNKDKDKEKHKHKDKDKSKGLFKSWSSNKDKDKDKDKDKTKAESCPASEADITESSVSNSIEIVNPTDSAEISSAQQSVEVENEAEKEGESEIREYIKAINPIILPHKGLIIFERNLVTIFLREINLPPCYDADDLPEVLVPPPVTGFKRIFGKKNDISIEEADRCFLFNRSEKKQDKGGEAADQKNDPKVQEDPAARAASIGNSLAETKDMMQQLLVKANERGEQLNELEIKAQRLLDSARQYSKTARQFRH